MNTNTINELNERYKDSYSYRTRSLAATGCKKSQKIVEIWDKRRTHRKQILEMEQGVINTTRTYSCVQCAKWAERKQKLVAWSLRCVGVVLTGAFHVCLTVGVVLAVTEGVIF